MLSIKSKIKEYSVNFIDFKSAIKDFSKDKTICIIDKNINNILEWDDYYCIEIDAGEENKEYIKIKEYIDQIIGAGFKKNWNLVSIGGGVIQDITGFIATILYRGVDWYYFPTTLLAQADSCIGGKSSINLGKYKNQVGTFYPPTEILIDTKFLKTLPVVDIKSGMGEVYKYHILDDNYELVSADYYKLIWYCLNVKKRYIETDEFDINVRNLLNYGHTFGHALETATGFEYPHGVCVAIGMDIANYISHKLNMLTATNYIRLGNFLKDILPSKNPLTEHNLNHFVESIKMDKKTISDKIKIIVKTNEGMQSIEMDTERLRMLINEYIVLNAP